MLSLDEIQPVEYYLTTESVDYFMKNPDRLFNEEPPIAVFLCDNRPFRYFAMEGNSRLYVCHKLGISSVPIVPQKLGAEEKSGYIDLAMDKYNSGIRKWSDFDTRIILREERSRYYNKKHNLEGKGLVD